MNSTVGNYAKLIVAVIGAGITSALALIAPGTDLFTVLTVVASMLTAVGVYLVPNTEVPDGPGAHRG